MSDGVGGLKEQDREGVRGSAVLCRTEEQKREGAAAIDHPGTLGKRTRMGNRLSSL